MPSTLPDLAKGQYELSHFHTFAAEAGRPAGIREASVQVASGRSTVFRGHVRAAYEAGAGDAAVREEGYIVAQRALRTEAAEALSQMSVRFGAVAGPLAGFVREHQDLLAARQATDKHLLEAIGGADAKTAEALKKEIARLDANLDAIDARLQRDFPDYFALVSPEPLTIAATQVLLQPGEVLLQFLDTWAVGKLSGTSFAWVITNTDARWFSVPLDTQAIRERVESLRCGLDHTLWQASDSAGRCTDALNASPTTEHVDGQNMRVLPFDVARAHDLYRQLLGPAEDLIKGKHLLIVPSGPLTSLPFNVLVAEPPKPGAAGKLAGYRDAAWLGTRQPITVLPSVASLKSLRQFAKASRATKPYFGIGNPLLDGQQQDPRWGGHFKAQAAAAREHQQCSKATTQRLAQAAAPPRQRAARLFRGPNADIEEVRQFSPLPETADELCEVGHRLGVPESEILLGARATEAALKDLSDSGRLADYAILHFATHGALTGQVQGATEPGLILTPPAKGTAEAKALDRDDGYLTASETATLKLDADWVVLSACNTAGGSDDNAEALSGLARAFFYAGARALLVSHWEVGSAAAVKLTTTAFAELRSNPGIGRAEAFRRSMRALAAGGTPAEAHPAMWAPFAVVGEGGAPAAALTTQAISPEPPTTAKDDATSAPSRTKPSKKPPATKGGDWQGTIWKNGNN